MKTNWVVIEGKADVKQNFVKYVPNKIKNDRGQEISEYTLLGSEVEFENGEMSFKLRLKEKNAQLHLIFNYNTTIPLVMAGINNNGFLYGITQYVQNKVENLNTVGRNENLPLEKDISFGIKVIGSEIELYIDKVQVCRAYAPFRKSQIRMVMQSEDEIEVKDFQIYPQKPKAFVVMQFSEEYNQLYNEVIKPVCESFSLECERADEYHTTNPIIQDIISSIKSASVIIADITPDNPNVFYEVGYSHAAGKPTILLCDKKREKLPFDVSSFRTLFYENTIAGKSQIEKKLKQYLTNIF